MRATVETYRASAAQHSRNLRLGIKANAKEQRTKNQVQRTKAKS
jgi:hypothetical protein